MYGPTFFQILDNRAILYLNVTFGLYDQLPPVFLQRFNDDTGQLTVKKIRQQQEIPVLQIEIDGEAELNAAMNDRQLDVDLNLHRSKAQLLSSKIGGISQKTVDLILSMSVPFLENAAALLMGNGKRMEHVSKNY